MPGDLKLKHITQREAEYENRDKRSIKQKKIKGKCQREVDWEERGQVGRRGCEREREQPACSSGGRHGGGSGWQDRREAEHLKQSDSSLGQQAILLF